MTRKKTLSSTICHCGGILFSIGGLTSHVNELNQRTAVECSNCHQRFAIPFELIQEHKKQKSISFQDI